MGRRLYSRFCCSSVAVDGKNGVGWLHVARERGSTCVLGRAEPDRSGPAYACDHHVVDTEILGQMLSVENDILNTGTQCGGVVNCPCVVTI